MSRIHRLTHGWQPDLPDHRDLSREIPQVAVLPASFDLLPVCPPVYDQGQLGSCTANAICAAVEVDFITAKAPDWRPSRLFVYYNERAMEGTIKQDSGAQIRDGVKTINTLGVCTEALLPYDITKFTAKPKTACFADALKNKSLKYERVVQTSNAIEQVLFSGKPVIFGFSVYESFESAEVAKTGIVNLPAKTEKLLGGHAVLIVGYDHQAARFLVRNSWGASWGQQGYFTIPYAYVCNSNLADDFWTIDTMTDGQ